MHWTNEETEYFEVSKELLTELRLKPRTFPSQSSASFTTQPKNHAVRQFEAGCSQEEGPKKGFVMGTRTQGVQEILEIYI